MARKQSGKAKRSVPKTVLRLPDLDQAKLAVLNSLSSIDAQRGYRHAIEEFIEWYCSEPRLSFSKTVVLRYRIHLESRHLAPGTVNLRLGAVRRLAYEASDCGLLSPDLAAGIRRVKGVKKTGVRLGNWLTPEQSQRLWNTPDSDSLKGKRDRALLAILLACGLRRHEAVKLDFRHIQQREEHWAIVDLKGKAGHTRTVPMPGWVKASDAAGGEQIQFLLGHVSIQTTERYLGCKQRIRGAVNDRIGIETPELIIRQPCPVCGQSTRNRHEQARPERKSQNSAYGNLSQRQFVTVGKESTCGARTLAILSVLRRPLDVIDH